MRSFFSLPRHAAQGGGSQVQVTSSWRRTARGGVVEAWINATSQVTRDRDLDRLVPLVVLQRRI